MLKGDKRKNEILNTAEYLFCSHGYVETGVQEILDVLHISKGSFYHHFLSKESVLEALCARHAEAAAAECEAALEKTDDALARLRIILAGILPLREEELNFLTMMLPVFDLPEGRMVRLCWQECLKSAFCPLLEKELGRLKEQQLILAVPGNVSSLCVDLVNRCWGDMVLQMVMDGKEKRRADLSALLDILELHRRAIERVLDAPYGSIVLCELEKLKMLSERLYRIATL